ncbi:MAG: acyl-CoA dehydrogenase family protein [Burkholderiales bacterium]
MQAKARTSRPPLGAEALPGLGELIRTELAPKTADIDLNGEYPAAFMRRLGELGGFAGAVSLAHGGQGAGLSQVIRVISQISEECMSTGFLVWCQTACAWYLENTVNDALRARMLPLVASGKVLAGTGLSNPMKACAAIEEVRLKAERVNGGYRINGTLPWVSNIGPGHVFACGAGVAGEPGLLVSLVSCDAPGMTLNQNAHFVALEGSNTFACQFRNVFVADADVIAHPREFVGFVTRIKAGFILAQMGMGVGLVRACVEMMVQSNKTLAHVNRFIDDQAEDIEQELTRVECLTYALADAAYAQRDDARLREVLELRIAGSELALRAASAAMLHLGAKGYLLRNPAQRRLREAYFIAIVTPAIKHLKKELYDMEHASVCCAA